MRLLPSAVTGEDAQTWPPDTLTLTLPVPALDSSGAVEIHLAFDSTLSAPTWLSLKSLGAARSMARLPVRSALVRTHLRRGDYAIMLHWDRDRNGVWDPGWPWPLAYSEPVEAIVDTLRVRARFTTEFHIAAPGGTADRNQLP